MTSLWNLNPKIVPSRAKNESKNHVSGSSSPKSKNHVSGSSSPLGVGFGDFK